MPFPTLPAPLARALTARDYEDPTPVQSAVIEAAAQGRDLLVSAQTGSGKTVAYGLAFAGTLLDGQDRLPPAGAPLCLVIAPTRELSLQVHRELAWLYGAAGGRIVSCVGGMDPRREQRELRCANPRTAPGARVGAAMTPTARSMLPFASDLTSDAATQRVRADAVADQQTRTDPPRGWHEATGPCARGRRRAAPPRSSRPARAWGG